MFNFDMEKILESIREDARNKMAEKNKLYKPLPSEADKYLHTKFFTFGRMTSGTKTAPKGHTCVFNANICTKTYGKIWFGDLNLTTDADRLKELASMVGEEIYVLREHDARFENEVKPKFENAVATYEAK